MSSWLGRYMTTTEYSGWSNQDGPTTAGTAHGVVLLRRLSMTQVQRHRSLQHGNTVGEGEISWTKHSRPLAAISTSRPILSTLSSRGARAAGYSARLRSLLPYTQCALLFSRAHIRVDRIRYGSSRDCSWVVIYCWSKDGTWTRDRPRLREKPPNKTRPHSRNGRERRTH